MYGEKTSSSSQFASHLLDENRDNDLFFQNLTSASRLYKPKRTKKTKQAIQSAEETALNAYSAFKNLQLGEKWWSWWF